jgi:hypothetical protein
MSARFALPFIMPGQAQKELFHNEALARVDALLHLAVEGEAGEPPMPAAAGSCWIVKDGAGEWAGRDGEIACRTSGGWRYVVPQAGTTAWHKISGLRLVWNGADWDDGAVTTSGVRIGGVQVVGPRQPTILSPSQGTVIDAESRSAIAQIIVALRTHGLTD